MSLDRLARVALAVTLFVILWGALVRATGSGAGCGAHWPTCDGQVLPTPKSVEMAIEFTHRATSGLSLLLVVWLFARVRGERPKRHPARSAAFASLILILVEALIGAGLVLFELVDQDASLARALVMGAHLVNTLFLLAALTATALWTSESETPRVEPPPAEARWFVACAALILVTGFGGAIAALGDTLFPAKTLAEGLAGDLSPASHWLLRVRVLHPATALATAAALLVLSHRIRAGTRDARSRGRAMWVAALALGQTLFGLVNLLLLAPIAMQIGHLLLADLLWIAFVALYVARRSEGVRGDFPPSAALALAA